MIKSYQKQIEVFMLLSLDEVCLVWGMGLREIEASVERPSDFPHTGIAQGGPQQKGKA